MAEYKPTFRCVIAGGRDFDDKDLLFIMCDRFLKPLLDTGLFTIQIMSGHCKTGADYYGEEYAREMAFPVELYRANWLDNGMAAGPIRNEQMAKACTGAIIFWDGKSRGSKSMIDMCERYKKAYKVVLYEENKVKEVHWNKKGRVEEVWEY